MPSPIVGFATPLRWVAKEMEDVSSGWGQMLTDALDFGDEAEITRILGLLSKVTQYHIRQRAKALDKRLSDPASTPDGCQIFQLFGDRVG